MCSWEPVLRESTTAAQKDTGWKTEEDRARGSYCQHPGAHSLGDFQMLVQKAWPFLLLHFEAEKPVYGENEGDAWK